MKKIISAFLILVMIFSVVCVSATAADGIYIQSDFSSMEALTRHFVAGSFYLDPSGSGLLYGYSEAQAFQTFSDDAPLQWSQYDVSVEMAVDVDSMSTGDRAMSVVYCNIELQNMGRYDGTYYISYAYDVARQQMTLCGESLAVNDENMLMDPVPVDLEDGKFYTYGMSVTKGRIRCFLDGELIFDYVDAANDLLLCHEDLPVPLVVWNQNNFVQIKDVKIASPGYLYPFMDNLTETTTAEPTPTETTTQGGDEPTPTETTTQGGDEPTPGTTTGKVEDPADSNDDPADTNKPADTNNPADTNKPADNNNTGNQQKPADTNTNQPVGGSSTATGDATFVVVAAMVAAIGCALIVKKVSVK